MKYFLTILFYFLITLQYLIAQYDSTQFNIGTQPILQDENIYGISKIMPPPLNVSASDGDYDDRIVVRWTPHKDTSVRYKIYRSDAPDGYFTLIRNWDKYYPLFDHKGDVLQSCKKYYYYVQAGKDSKTISGPSNIDSGCIGVYAIQNLQIDSTLKNSTKGVDNLELRNPCCN